MGSTNPAHPAREAYLWGPKGEGSWLLVLTDASSNLRVTAHKQWGAPEQASQDTPAGPPHPTPPWAPGPAAPHSSPPRASPPKENSATAQSHAWAHGLLPS